MLRSTSPGTCTRGLLTQKRPTSRPIPKPASPLVSACTPSSPPPRRVLEQASHEAGEAARLGPAAQRDEHGEDQRHVGSDARPRPRPRTTVDCSDAATDDHEQQEQAAHA